MHACAPKLSAPTALVTDTEALKLQLTQQRFFLTAQHLATFGPSRWAKLVQANFPPAPILDADFSERCLSSFFLPEFN
jgi:hypothetical protein